MTTPGCAKRAAPEVIDYLNAENAYTTAVTAPLKPLEEKLYNEMLSHIKETDVSVAYRSGGFFYYMRTTEGCQYPTHCRRAATSLAPDTPYDESQPEQIILDVNKLAEGQPYMSLGAMAISPDGKLLAYTTDNTGFRQYTLHIRDLTSGKHLDRRAFRCDRSRTGEGRRTRRLARVGGGLAHHLLHRGGRGDQAAQPALPPQRRRGGRSSTASTS